MSKARLVITAVVVEGRSQAEVARAYGISKGWVSKLVARYRAEGDTAFEPRSRRPRTSPNATDAPTIELVIGLRRKLVAAGLDAAPPGREFLARYERQSATPRAARLLRELSAQIDVRAACEAISVPTLILHSRHDRFVPFEYGEELAALIPGAKFVALEGRDHYILAADAVPIIDAIETFVTGARRRLVSDHVLATVMFVDIVDSTQLAARIGDEHWIALLDRFNTAAATVVDEYRGTLVKHTGDGVMATFDGPGRAVQAAAALRDAATPLGLALRSGLHTAEIQRRDGDIAGIGVHIASRVASTADPGEVWVSRTVTDLVAGTGLNFTDRGTHEPKGLEQPWARYSAVV